MKDSEYFTVLPLNDLIEKEADKMIEKYQLKTLDSIQLTSGIIQKELITAFVAADGKVLKVDESENFESIDKVEYVACYLHPYENI